jgi:hypothetical protein
MSVQDRYGKHTLESSITDALRLGSILLELVISHLSLL